MNKHLPIKQLIIAASIAMLPLAQAATLAKADYAAEKTRIGATYKVDKAACASLTANAKDICVEQAQAKEKVARAELEYAYTGKVKDQNHVLVTKAKTDYAVAKEKCDDSKGNDKDVCVKQAKAIEVAALADAKLGKQIGEARTDAKVDKRDAEYKVEAEKCDALAGDAKSSCMTAAKARFGKT